MNIEEVAFYSTMGGIVFSLVFDFIIDNIDNDIPKDEHDSSL